MLAVERLAAGPAPPRPRARLLVRGIHGVLAETPGADAAPAAALAPLVPPGGLEGQRSAATPQCGRALGPGGVWGCTGVGEGLAGGQRAE